MCQHCQGWSHMREAVSWGGRSKSADHNLVSERSSKAREGWSKASKE